MLLKILPLITQHQKLDWREWTWYPMKLEAFDGLIRARLKMYLQEKEWAGHSRVACATCLPCRMSIIRIRQLAKIKYHSIGTLNVDMAMAQIAEIWMIFKTRSNSLDSDDRRLAIQGKSLRSSCIFVNNLVNWTMTCTNNTQYQWHAPSSSR